MGVAISEKATMAPDHISSPLVSIVVPCFNAALWIEDAILSALAQSYRPIEIIVIDDGSTDRSRETILKFEKRIQFQFIDHRGAAHVRNRAVEMASGELIQFLDADDILFPHCVKRKVEAMLAEAADVVYSGGFFFNVGLNAGNYEAQGAPGYGRENMVSRLIETSIVTTLLMCRKASLERVGGFDETLMNGQEHDLLLRFAVDGYKFVCVPEALSLNRTGHNTSSITCMTYKDPYYLEGLFARFEEKLRNTEVWTPRVRASLAIQFHHVGVAYLSVHNRTRAIMMFRRARKIDRKYVFRLPFSRRYLVPFLGGYLTELMLKRFARYKQASHGRKKSSADNIVCGQTIKA